MPTLEEVFLKLEEDTEENNKTIEGSQNPSFYSSVLPLDVQEPTNVDGDSTLLDPSKITPNMQKDSGLIKLHIWALMKIRFLLTIRSKALLLFQILLPVGLVAAGIAVSRISQKGDTSHPISLQISAAWYANVWGFQAVSNNYMFLDSVGEWYCHFQMIIFS